MKRKSPLPHLKRLSSRIREARDSLGFSLEEAAFRADISRTQFSRIERGISFPSVTTLCRVEKALQLPKGSLAALTITPDESELATFEYPLKSEDIDRLKTKKNLSIVVSVRTYDD